jgi:TolA-binding protein
VALLGLLIVFSACGKKLPGDDVLFEQGQQFGSSNEYVKALESYVTLIDSYPQSQYRYKAMFMAGMIQFEYMNNREKAAEMFDKIVKEYPDCDLADDAAVLRDVVITGRDVMSVFEDSIKTQ